jgi:hypothetical protein
MAYSQSDLDALDRAIASGALRVDYPNSGSVTYRSLADMQQIRNNIFNAINAASGTPRPRRVKVWSTKDL